MSKVFFTGDTHFGHKGIIGYQPNSRGHFKNVDDMDQTLIRRWNEKVKPDDTVYHVGDVAWSNPQTPNIIKRLHGKKVLIPGNHDINLLKDTKFIECWEKIAPPLFEIIVDSQIIVMCHYPLWEWRAIQYGAWHLHGHVHAKPTGIPGKILDVGADNNCLEPFSFSDIKRFMDQKPVRTHH